MPDFPFGAVIDPRDAMYEAQADAVRVEVWEGVTSTAGGMCTTYAAPIERLADALGWQRDNPTLHVNVAVSTHFDGQVLLLIVSPHTAMKHAPIHRGRN